MSRIQIILGYLAGVLMFVMLSWVALDMGVKDKDPVACGLGLITSVVAMWFAVALLIFLIYPNAKRR